MWLRREQGQIVKVMKVILEAKSASSTVPNYTENLNILFVRE